MGRCKLFVGSKMLPLFSSNKKPMKRNYNADVRENNPLYLICQAQQLLKIAFLRKSSSPIIYACLD
jgi:hypothetical protein